MQQRQFHKVPDIAQRYGVTPESVRHWIKSGHITAFRTGSRGHYLVSEDELRRFEGQR